RRAGRMKGLVNAVLRRVGEAGPEAVADLDPREDWPRWLTASWEAAYGAEAARRIAAMSAREAPLDLTVARDAQAWADRLGGRLTATGSVRLPPGHAPVPDLPGFHEGAWWVQDAAAALPARLLGPVNGQRVLDLCAAPGGKTLQLAAAGARVTAVDRAPARLKRVRENLARTGLDAALVAADAAAYRPETPVDAVLLDAPCTATGTLRRRPDTAWIKSPRDVDSLQRLQIRLIAAAAAALPPGGRVVYCTCSLQPGEGEGAIEGALKAGAPLTPDPIGSDEAPGLPEAIGADGFLRTFPYMWEEAGGMDGFFAARLRRI
ncbi:MAG: RsmB/NOP family class I SAM-dependent RNA methyltransferase, partial [Caulobacterales bacterium]|nr:RsmB/NOP family class I SAM-dependent RNA methyltransferase [Caulobacterales bacterium]